MAEFDKISVKKTQPSSKEPINLGPFSEPDENTDIAFVVEETKIYFNKTLLCMSSPVFKRMLFGNFAEKDAKEIPLPFKTYKAVVTFLKIIHPAFLTEVTDYTLLGLLGMAREYQVESVQNKCEQYLTQKTAEAERAFPSQTAWSVDRLLLYVSTCYEYHFPKLLPRLVSLAANAPTDEITGCKTYTSRPSLAYLEILKSRCADLEKQCSSLENMLRGVRSSLRVAPMQCSESRGCRCCMYLNGTLTSVIKNISKVVL